MPTNFKNSTRETRRRVLFCVVLLGIAAGLFILPYQFRSEAGSDTRKGFFDRTVSSDLANYDIRSDKAAYDKVAAFRQAQSRSATDVADVRDNFVRGEASLRARVPSLKIDYNTDIRIPEVIGPDVKQGRAFLTAGSSTKRSDILLNFLRENTDLTGVRSSQVNELKVFSDYTNPDGNLSFVELNQEINGIPVFRGEVKAGFTKQGEMIRVINNLAPGLDYGSLAIDFGSPAEAVRTAAGHINHSLRDDETSINEKASNNLKAVFGQGDWATTAEKMYFPTEPGVAIAAWRVLIWQPVNAYYVIVDAHTGTMLWRKNLTDDQSETATYQVYNNTNSTMQVADSPAPLSPYVSANTSPADAAQGPIMSRTSVTLIGNEAPFTFNNNGWITNGANTTDGNALEAGLDLIAPNGVDAGTQATGSPSRTFTSLWNPPPGSPAPGDVPSAVESRRGAVIQMFYIMNRYHDELYRVGFTEPARNYQADNFSRGGVANDRISAEGQDFSGTNNANFSSGADGTRGRMQMYVWTGPNPDRDGTGDAEIMIHEVTHGTSNRLHGNSAGLSINMSGAMGEGWGDFYAHTLLSEPSDNTNGAYALSGYSLFQAFGVVGNASYYYGIRRFPKARLSSTGGPNNRPHNPMTFKDIDQTQMDLTDGAFAPMAGPHISTAADQVHAAGEVWSSMLWEIRCKMVDRLGTDAGNRRVLQVVTDGMKLAPLGPTFITERDAILAGVLASGTGGDVADTWAGFAARGLGVSASIQANGTGNGSARVTEATDLPNLQQTPDISVSDTIGDNDGYAEPGEPVTLLVPLFNLTGREATGTTVTIPGVGVLNYDNIGHNIAASQQINYTIPAATPCGSAITLTLNINSSLGPISVTRYIIVGVPNITLSENFDGVTAPIIPAGWTSASVSGGIPFVTSTNNSDTAPNSAFALDPLTVGGGTDLTSPSTAITASAAVVTFRNRYDTEGGWDGGVLEISVGGGPFTDIITAGGRFISNGYNGLLGAGANNPLANRPAWNGSSGGNFLLSSVQLPASAAGQNVQLRWRFGADDNTAGLGWNVDTIKLAGSYSCSFTGVVKSRADFDGDGRTDLSVYRPSEGNWFVNRSTAGFFAVKFGLSNDVLIPGDYDGDGKTDTAVYRANPTPGEPDIFILNSNGFTFTAFPWGVPLDVPVFADYDGDGKTDYAVYRPSNNIWYVYGSALNNDIFTIYGQAGDIPVAGDFDGDGKADITVYRGAGQWHTIKSSGGTSSDTFGLAGDKLVPADYDGDNKDDLAVFRNGTWFYKRSIDGAVVGVPFGLNTDILVPGDYDGDGRDDQAVYRGGTWFINQSTAGYITAAFGLAADKPVPAGYIP
jgi:hypothetical protein